jgi:predicted HTH transcriptional regulator
LEQDVGGLVQRCLCGLMKPVVKHAEGSIQIIHATRAADVVMPANGTKTRRCLLAVAAALGTITTGEVALNAGLSNKETAAMLVTLMARGLVERMEERRGLPWGSKWRVTVVARSNLG